MNQALRDVLDFSWMYGYRLDTTSRPADPAVVAAAAKPPHKQEDLASTIDTTLERLP
jgi:hypothetical protein